LKPHIRNIKREDASMLLDVLLERKSAAPVRELQPDFAGWQFNETTQWSKLRA
jgi:hypothetical protein